MHLYDIHTFIPEICAKFHGYWLLPGLRVTVNCLTCDLVCSVISYRRGKKHQLTRHYWFGNLSQEIRWYWNHSHHVRLIWLPMTYFLFPRMKETMNGQHFEIIDVIKQKSLCQLYSIQKYSLEVSNDWGTRWQKCIVRNGDYFEWDNFNWDE